MSPLHNAKHELFAQEIAAGKTLEEAHRAAGYSPNRRNADVLRKRQDISRRIQTILTQRSDGITQSSERAVKRAAISKEWIIEKLRENALNSLAVGTPTYNATAANKALELLGKEIGMFIARSEVGKPGDFTELSDGELADRITAELVAGGVPLDVARAFARARSTPGEEQA